MMTYFKRFRVFLLLLLIGLLFGCASEPQRKPYVPPEEFLEEIATPEPTEVPTEELKDAVEGHFDGKTHVYYVTTSYAYRLPFSGSAADWEVKDDPYELITEGVLSVEEGMLIMRPEGAGVVKSAGSSAVSHVRTGTGYVYFENAKTKEVTKVYVSLEVRPSDPLRQANDAFPYYIYVEKGPFKSFKPGDCSITIYRADEDGFFTIPYRTASIGCGLTSTLTPAAYYYLNTKENETLLTGPEKDEKGNIIPESFNKIGYHKTEGAVIMEPEMLEWIFENCPKGTKIEVRTNNPRGNRTEVPPEMELENKGE